MSMVKVKYGEPYRTSFGKEEEKIKAKTLGDLLEKIEKRYDGKEYVDTLSKYSMIVLNNEKFLDQTDLKFKLKPKDEVLIMQMLSGG